MPNDAQPLPAADDELLDQIVADFTAQLRDGQHPSIDKFQQTFPNLSDEINELLSSVAMIEQLKASTTATSGAPADLSELTDLKQIGDYDLIREVGRGGMGIVFEAVHRSLGRKVALKIMPRGILENKKYLTRFQREAQAAARLHHSNIVSVFGVGNDQGHYYYVMEFIDGANLSEVVQRLGSHSKSGTQNANIAETVHWPKHHQESDSRNPSGIPNHNDDFSVANEDLQQPNVVAPGSALPTGKERFRWAASLGHQIADALAYAHTEGILHRDIKPSNLILDANNRVWITDFGLVKNIADQTLTQTGDIVGTIQYMPVEAFQGEYDSRSETYGLGLTLFELVTLEPAFKSLSTPEMIHAIMNDTPLAPVKIDHQIPRDLNTIIVKAIARDPKARYQTAAQLRDDLDAFINDRPILARRPSAWEQAIKWAKRNPLAAAFAALSVFLILTVAVVATFSYLETKKAYQVASSRATRLKQEYDRAEANVALTVEAFDKLYRQVVFGKDVPEDVRADGFRELAGVETVVTEKDAAVLQSLIQFYERFANQNQGNKTLISESAKAFRRVANIYMLLGEARKSIDVYRSAVDIYKQELKNAPDSLERLLEFVRTNNEYANALQIEGGNWAAYQAAFHDSQTALENHPLADSRDVQLELARTLNYMGTTASLNLVTISAVQSDRRKSPVFSGMSRRHPRFQRYPNRSGRSRDEAWESRRQDWRQQRYNRKATDIIVKLLVSAPDDPELKIELAKSYSYLALFQLRSDRDKSIEFLQKSISIFEQMVKDDPGNSELRYRLALACAMPTAYMTENGRELLDKSLGLVDQLTNQYPMVLEYQQLKAVVYAKKADIFLGQEKPDEALVALEITEQIMSDIMSRSSFNSRLPLLHEGLSDLYLDLAKEFLIARDNESADLAEAKSRELQQKFNELKAAAQKR